MIDPGPASGEQLDVLCDALKGETITHILITHCHADHSGAADALKQRTGAPTCGMPRGAGAPSAEAKGPSGRSFVVPVAFDIPLQHGSQIKATAGRCRPSTRRAMHPITFASICPAKTFSSRAIT